MNAIFIRFKSGKEIYIEYIDFDLKNGYLSYSSADFKYTIMFSEIEYTVECDSIDKLIEKTYFEPLDLKNK